MKIKSRLEPGKMFLVDFDSGEIVPDSAVKESVASARPYQTWLDQVGPPSEHKPSVGSDFFLFVPFQKSRRWGL